MNDTAPRYVAPPQALAALVAARDSLVEASNAMWEREGNELRHGAFVALCGGIADAVDGAIGLLTEITGWSWDPFACAPVDDGGGSKSHD